MSCKVSVGCAASAMLLVLAMLLVSVSGIERNITSMEDFEQFRSEMAVGENSDSVFLLCDLNFNGMDGLLPVGVNEDNSTVYPFKGVFNGTGHWIRGLKINTVGMACEVAGLFGLIDGATVCDLNFDEDCEFVGIRSGSVAGLQKNYRVTNLTNIHTYGTVEGEHAGGMIGYMDSIAYKVYQYHNDCHNHGPVTARMLVAKSTVSLSAGGIVGTMTHGPSNNENADEHYDHSSNDGNVTVLVTGLGDTVKNLECRCGGILGGHDYFSFGDSYLNWCNNSGAVSIIVSNYSAVTQLTKYQAVAGGFLGYSSAASTIINLFDCINTGSVYVSPPPPSNASMATVCYAGGITGYLDCGHLERRRLNVINMGDVTCYNGTASGIDNTRGSTSSRPFEIQNCANSGCITGDIAYGIANCDPAVGENVVSMGFVNGTKQSKAMFIASPANITENTTLFVLDSTGCSDANEYNIIYRDECDVCFFQENDTEIKVSDMLNEKISGYVWNDRILKTSYIVEFYGAYNSTLCKVEPGTKLSSLLKEDYRLFLENGTEVKASLIVQDDLKLMLVNHVATIVITTKVNDTSEIAQIIADVKESMPDCVVSISITEDNTVTISITTEYGNEQEIVNITCRAVKCDTVDVRVPSSFLYLSAAVKSFMDMSLMIILLFSISYLSL